MSPTYELIDSITLSSDQSSISFDNIPQTYDDLMVVISARSSRSSATADGMAIKLNNSTSNFTNRILYADTGSVGSGSNTTSNIFDAPASSATANTFSNGVLYIPNYSSSQYKSLSGYGVNENNSTAAAIVRRSLLWSNTSAISSINIFSNTSSNFVTNSTFELYGIKNADDGSEGYFGPAARGGDEVYTTGDGYKVHVFKTSGTLEVTAPGEVEYLVVAGGGSGGGNSTLNMASGGGGGAGGLVTSYLMVAPNITYTVTVGGGGSGNAGAGASGSDSSLFNVTANGGGRGGSFDVVGGASGGSGGGGSGRNTSETNIGGTGILGQGASGGNGFSSATEAMAGGGGGGANASGAAASAGTGGNGGNGAASSISGTSVTYAGGGGGGATHRTTVNSAGTGGAGGGGNGFKSTSSSSGGAGDNGIANRGGGGGGGAYGSAGGTFAGGNGGSGIVIIRYKV